MAGQYKILLLDDDEQMLEIFQDFLRKLPSKPEIHASNSGARAIALLDSEPFSLLITDLRMPKMDGLQVLAIVRRKHPHLRVLVLTGVIDEEYRSRAYALGVDMFWHKPAKPEEFQLLKDCIESLLDREAQIQGGFRGMQSKSLVDLIQLECLSQSSAILLISQGGVSGKIWVQNGEIIDAATASFTGEEAFREILSWKAAISKSNPRSLITSAPSIIPPKAFSSIRPRRWMNRADCHPAPNRRTPRHPPDSPLAPLARFEGVEFLLTMPPDEKAPCESWGLENPQEVAAWARSARKRLDELGVKTGAGSLTNAAGFGLQRHWALAGHDQKGWLCAGFRRTLPREKVVETMKHIFSKWVS